MIDISFLIGKLNREHGGAQQLLYDLCTHLPDDEFDITVYYMFGEGTFQPAFEAADTDVTALRANTNYDLQAFVRLVRALDRNRPDVLQTNSPISGAWGRIAAQLVGVPEVVSVEHNVHNAYPYKHRIVNGTTLPFADAIVGVSTAVVDSIDGVEKTWLEATSRPDRRSIPNGVDIATIDAAQQDADDVLDDYDSIEPSDIIVGTMGSHTPQKGFENLVRAMPDLRRDYPDLKTIILGDGPLRSSLEQIAENHGVADRVTFTGYVEDVYPFLSHFDVGVFPSRWEGFGLVVAEAMAAGVPVVASDIPAFREIVDDTGILVQPDSPDALAAAVGDLLDDRPRRRHLASAGRKRVVQHFSIEKAASEYAELYRTLLNQ